MWHCTWSHGECCRTRRHLSLQQDFRCMSLPRHKHSRCGSSSSAPLMRPLYPMSHTAVLTHVSCFNKLWAPCCTFADLQGGCRQYHVANKKATSSGRCKRCLLRQQVVPGSCSRCTLTYTGALQGAPSVVGPATHRRAPTQAGNKPSVAGSTAHRPWLATITCDGPLTVGRCCWQLGKGAPCM